MENPTLKQLVNPENDLKNILVEYVGNKLNPEDKAKAEAQLEEDQQGLDDVEAGKKLSSDEKQKN